MPRYERLSVDFDTEWWTLRDPSLEAVMDAPLERVAQPLTVEVDGRSPGELMTFARGFRLEATTDLFAGPALASLLERASLPGHVAVECRAQLVPYDLRTLRMRKKRSPPRPYRWLSWTETFATRIDLSRSRFLLRYRDGTRAEAQYEELEDLQQVQRRAATTLDFDIAPDTLEWIDEGMHALDVIPLQDDVFLSPRLASTLREAALDGVRVLPPRVEATVLG